MNIGDEIYISVPGSKRKKFFLGYLFMQDETTYTVYMPPLVKRKYKDRPGYFRSSCLITFFKNQLEN